MNIDDYIRDYSFKNIDGKALIGIEVESKYPESLYYNLMTITFLKNGEEVHKEETDVPFLPPKGLIYVGRCYDFTDFDEIKIHMISVQQVYESSYYPNVEFGIDQEKTNGKHLEYKVVNNNTVPIPEATLNLLFYNRGELVCGTDVKIGKLINGRTYYFVYDIPDGLEYTDVNTELTLPNTGYLLFKSYYKEYLLYESEIDDLSEPYKKKSHETLKDLTDEMNKKISGAEKQIKIAKKKDNKVVKALVFLWTFFVTSLLAALILMGVSLVTVIVMGIIVELGWLPKEWLDSTTADIIIIVVWIITGALVYIWRFRKKFEKEAIEGDLMPSKKVKEIIDNQNKIITESKQKIEDFNNNREKLEKEIEDKNKEIDKENEEIQKQEDRRLEDLNSTKEEFAEFKNNYPEYSEFDTYDAADRMMCEAAFASGALTFDAVKECRNIILQKLEQEQKYQEEMAMRRKEQQLMAEQTEAINRQADAQRYASTQIEAAIKEQAAMQRTMINEQIAASDRAAKAAASATAQVNMNLNSLNTKLQQDMTYYR